MGCRTNGLFFLTSGLSEQRAVPNVKKLLNVRRSSQKTKQEAHIVLVAVLTGLFYCIFVFTIEKQVCYRIRQAVLATGFDKLSLPQPVRLNIILF